MNTTTTTTTTTTTADLAERTGTTIESWALPADAQVEIFADGTANAMVDGYGITDIAAGNEAARQSILDGFAAEIAEMVAEDEAEAARWAAFDAELAAELAEL